MRWISIFCFAVFVFASCSSYEEIYYIPADTYRTERLRLSYEAQDVSAHVIRRAQLHVEHARIQAACTQPQPEELTVVLAHRASPPIAPAGDRRIDLNTATRRQLERLPRVGPSTAQAIIDARPFSTIEDVMRVKGIGPATFAQIQDKIKVAGPGG